MVTDSTHITGYVDGAAQSITLGGAINTASGFLNVAQGNGGNYFTGSLGEVRILSSAQPASGVGSLMNMTYLRLQSTTTVYDDSALPSITTYSADSMPRALYFDMSTMKVGQPSNTLEDLSGNGNTGYFYSTNTIAGKVGNALQFSANKNSYAYVPVARGASLTPPVITVSLWFNISTGYTATNQMLISKWNCANPGIGYYLYYNGASNILSWNIGTNGGGANVYTASYGFTATANTWYHVVGTYDRSKLVLYVNGVSDATTAGNGLPIAASNSYLDIGMHSSCGTLFLSGSVDEVQVLPTALTSGQVAALYHGYTPGSSSFDATHVSRVYFNGLGQENRELAMDLYGNSLTTSQALGWNGAVSQDNQTNGYYSAYSYRYDGSTHFAVGPAGLTMSGTLSYPGQLKVASFDGDLHRKYVQADILGRTVQAGAYNVSGNSYNYTVTARNALGLATSATTYHGTTADYTFTTYYNSVGMPVASVNPNGQVSLTMYDNDLRLLMTTDSLGHAALNTYVSTSGSPGYGMGWLAGVALKTSTAAAPCTTCTETFGYDWVGDLTTATNYTTSNSAMTVTRAYDGLYRLQTETTSTNGMPNLAVNYSYDSAGRTTFVGYTVGALTQGMSNYTYDTLGRVSSVGFNLTKYAGVGYDAYGRLSKVEYFNGAATDLNEYQNYSYDAGNRATATGVLSGGSGGVNTMQLVYKYDPASLVSLVSDGMVWSGSAWNFKTTTYGYDGNGRLAYAKGYFSSGPLASGDNALAWENATYDAYGYMLKFQDSNFGACTSSCLWSTSQTESFTRGSNYLQVGAVTGAGPDAGKSVAYNGDGSVTSDGYHALAYDYNQRATQVSLPADSGCSAGSSDAYVYDGLGRTLKQTETLHKGAGGSCDSWGPNTLYFAYTGSNVAFTYNATAGSGKVASYVYLRGSVLFRRGSGETNVHYYAYDLSSNLRAVLSYSGSLTIETKQRYKPFGLMATPVTPTAPDPRFTFAGTQGVASASTVNMQLPALPLYSMGARVDSPGTGRFLARDPLGLHDYSYAANNPVSFRDPSGLDVAEAMRDEVPPDLGISTPLDVGESQPIVLTQWATSDGGFAGMTWEMPAGAVPFGDSGDLVTAPAAEVQATLETSGVTPTAAGQAAKVAAGSTTVISVQSDNGRTTARADIRKFSNYAFDQDRGGGKGRVFVHYGYGPEDSEILANDFAAQAANKFDAGDYRLGEADQYGQRITIDIQLNGVGEAAGTATSIQTAWMIEPDGSIRLITPFAGFTP